MKIIKIITVFVFMAVCLPAIADDGLITKQSDYTVAETMNNLEKILVEKGLTVFTRINHQKNAENIGINTHASELLIFGNPKLGSPLFISQATSAIDLPMKALAWQDENGNVWLTYNNPTYIAQRHNITNRNKIITKMVKALNMFTNKAILKN